MHTLLHIEEELFLKEHIKVHVFLELYLLYRETTRKAYKHLELCYTGLTLHKGDIHMVVHDNYNQQIKAVN